MKHTSWRPADLVPAPIGATARPTTRPTASTLTKCGFCGSDFTLVNPAVFLPCFHHVCLNCSGHRTNNLNHRDVCPCADGFEPFHISRSQVFAHRAVHNALVNPSLAVPASSSSSTLDDAVSLSSASASASSLPSSSSSSSTSAETNKSTVSNGGDDDDDKKDTTSTTTTIDSATATQLYHTCPLHKEPLVSFDDNCNVTLCKTCELAHVGHKFILKSDPLFEDKARELLPQAMERHVPLSNLVDNALRIIPRVSNIARNVTSNALQVGGQIYEMPLNALTAAERDMQTFLTLSYPMLAADLRDRASRIDSLIASTHASIEEITKLSPTSSDFAEKGRGEGKKNDPEEEEEEDPFKLAAALEFLKGINATFRPATSSSSSSSSSSSAAEMSTSAYPPTIGASIIQDPLSGTTAASTTTTGSFTNGLKPVNYPLVRFASLADDMALTRAELIRLQKWAETSLSEARNLANIAPQTRVSLRYLDLVATVPYGALTKNMSDGFDFVNDLSYDAKDGSLCLAAASRACVAEQRQSPRNVLALNNHNPCWSPDCSKLATYGNYEPRSIYISDIANGTKISCPSPFTTSIIRWSRDGAYLAVGSTSGHLFVANTTFTATASTYFGSGRNCVTAMDIHPTRHVVFAGLQCGIVYMYKFGKTINSSASSPASSSTSSSSTSSTSSSSSSSKLPSGFAASSTSSQPSEIFLDSDVGSTQSVLDLAFSSCGEYVAVGYESSVVIASVTRATRIWKFNNVGLTKIAWHPKEPSLVALGCRNLAATHRASYLTWITWVNGAPVLRLTKEAALAVCWNNIGDAVHYITREDGSMRCPVAAGKEEEEEENPDMKRFAKDVEVITSNPIKRGGASSPSVLV